MDEVRTSHVPATAVVPGSRVHSVNEAIRIGPTKPGAKAPRVELIRENDIVRALEITCSCGERIVVRCDYD
jgi:hypothetical protein